MTFLPGAEDLVHLGIWSELFMMIGYGYILFVAANLIGDGCEKLLLIYGPGIVGGLVIPILGAVPDGAIILVSGLGGGSKAELQKQIAVGVGTLAGSTIMLLTVPFAASIWFGSRALGPSGEGLTHSDSRSKKCPLVRDTFLWSDGVTVNSSIPMSAKLAIVTSLSYLIIQIPAFMYSGAKDASAREHLPALIGLIVSVSAFFAYSWFQITDANALEQQGKRETQKKMQQWQRSLEGKFGQGNRVLRMVFEKFDTKGENSITLENMKDGLQLLGLDLTRSELVQTFTKFDTNTDGQIDFNEFKNFAKNYFNIVAQSHGSSSGSSSVSPPNATEGTPLLYKQDELRVNSIFQENTRSGDEEEEAEEEEEYLELTDRQLIMSALLLLISGTALVTVFSDPMCSAIQAFAETTGIPAFYISFIITPLASNASEVLASLRFAKKKTTEAVSLSAASLFGAACMNNTFCLSIFFALIYFRGLTWSFSAETIAILIIIWSVGMNGLRQFYRNWQGIFICALFPFSLVLVAILNPILDF